MWLKADVNEALSVHVNFYSRVNCKPINFLYGSGVKEEIILGGGVNGVQCEKKVLKTFLL